VLGIPVDRQTNPTTKHLADVMRALGWTKPPHVIRVGSVTCQGYTKTIAKTKTIPVAKPKLITNQGEVVITRRLIRRLI